MKKFHSTITRRDFMKALGLTGASLGAAAATAPVFHDLDEVIASPQAGITTMPWYCSEKDEPTVPIDWSLIQRYDPRNNSKARAGMIGNQIVCPDGVTRMYHPATKAEWDTLVAYFKTIFDNWDEGTLGIGDTRYTSFVMASHWFAFGSATDGQRKPINLYPKSAFEGINDPSNPTHAELGMPKWQGTEEENFRMMQAVNRFWGGADIGVVKMDSNTKKLIFANDSKGTPYVWEDVSRHYDASPQKKVLPNSYTNCLVHTYRQGLETTQRQAGIGDASPSMLAYATKWMTEIRLVEFLRMLGYGGTAESMSGSGAMGVLAGNGELVRMHTPICHPRWGTTTRGVDRIMTDLPLPATKPIDFGARQFCFNCKICAEVCVLGSIWTEGPKWEGYAWNNSGYETWYTDMSKCPHCTLCHGSCVFNTLEEGGSAIHDFVKGTVSMTSLFNGFFAQMDRTFGYEKKRDPREWFDEVGPTWGIDSRW